MNSRRSVHPKELKDLKLCHPTDSFLRYFYEISFEFMMVIVGPEPSPLVQSPLFQLLSPHQQIEQLFRVVDKMSRYDQKKKKSKKVCFLDQAIILSLLNFHACLIYDEMQAEEEFIKSGEISCTGSTCTMARRCESFKLGCECCNNIQELDDRALLIHNRKFERLRKRKFDSSKKSTSRLIEIFRKKFKLYDERNVRRSLSIETWVSFLSLIYEGKSSIKREKKKTKIPERWRKLALYSIVDEMKKKKHRKKVRNYPMIIDDLVQRLTFHDYINAFLQGPVYQSFFLLNKPYIIPKLRVLEEYLALFAGDLKSHSNRSKKDAARMKLIERLVRNVSRNYDQTFSKEKLGRKIDFFSSFFKWMRMIFRKFPIDFSKPLPMNSVLEFCMIKGKEDRQLESDDNDVALKNKIKNFMDNPEEYRNGLKLSIMCSGCGEKNEEEKKKFKKCSRCKVAYYCSYRCQKNDWKSHSQICLKLRDDLSKCRERNISLYFGQNSY